MCKVMQGEQFTARRITHLVGWLICIPLILSVAADSALGSEVMDELTLSAEISPDASSGVSMDVTNNRGVIYVVGERGHILYCDNGCQSWTQAEAVPVSVTLTAVQFASPKKGWAVGHQGVVLHTQDGGKTWVKQLDGNAINPKMLIKIEGMIESKKRALKTAQESGDADRLEALSYKLEDLDYFKSDVEVAVDEGPIHPLFDLWFKNEKVGVVIGAFGMILRTTDGGASWEVIIDHIDNTSATHYYGVTQCGNSLFIAGEAGKLFRSDDWGENWRSLVSPYDGSFFGITGSPDGRFVVAYGLIGNTFYSSDMGETWSASQHDCQASISGGTVLADGSVCLIGSDGTLMRSEDEGRSFSKLSQRFTRGIAMAERNAGELVSVGIGGFRIMEIY